MPDKTVVILAETYLPGYKAGGPVRSIANMVASLGHEFHFKIMTMDRDVGEKLPYPGIIVNKWVRVGEADVMYLQPGFRGLFHLLMRLRSMDHHTTLYLNSFFARRFSMLPVLMRWIGLCRPHSMVLAPRGELSLGALGIKRRKKRIYLWISRWLGIYDPAIWQASSHFEAADISRQFPALWNSNPLMSHAADNVALVHIMPKNAIITARDVPGKPLCGASSKPEKRIGELRIVFVGRCSRMKNLSGALKLLEGVTGEVLFSIYGPIEDKEYWRECQHIISTLPVNIQVRNHGQIDHERVWQVLVSSDLLFLPTLGENFGHVIAESLSSGCPVLISDQTPWRNLEAAGAGWDLPLHDIERFRTVLQRCVDSDNKYILEMSRRANTYADEHVNNRVPIEANRLLFRLASGT